MTRTRLLILASITALAALVGAAFWWSDRTPDPTSDLVRQATPTEVRETIVAGAAKVTVLNFWAQWCEPCKREFPLFLKLRKEWADRGVKVLFVSVDDRSDFFEVETFLRNEGVDFPTFYKGKQSLNFVAELFPKWSGAVPATILFGPTAELLDAWEGDTSWKELVTKISAALERH